METKYNSGGKSWPKKDHSHHHHHQTRVFRARNNGQRGINLVDDVVSCSEEGEVVRMKVLVRKRDLKQVLEAMAGSNNGGNRGTWSSSQLEQRLNFLRRKQLSRANLARPSRRGPWSPVLQSIPEEF